MFLCFPPLTLAICRSKIWQGQGHVRAKGYQGPSRAIKGPCLLLEIAAKVSHDQYFLSQVATQFWSVADGKLTVTWHHLASPGITWHHLAIAPNEHRVVIGCHRLSMLSVGCQWNQWMPCMSASLLPRPQVYRDLSDAKAATYGASAALGESW